MNFHDLSARLAAHHQDHPQRSRLAELALSKVQEGLSELAALGHNFHLEDGPQDPPQEWPKMVYHANWREGRVVGSSEELSELGPGWFDHPAKVDQAEGLATQFEGRGGVPKPAGVPAPTGLTEPTRIDQERAQQGGGAALASEASHA